MGNNYTLNQEFFRSFAILEEAYFNSRNFLIRKIREGETPEVPTDMMLLPDAVAQPMILNHSLVAVA